MLRMRTEWVFGGLLFGLQGDPFDTAQRLFVLLGAAVLAFPRRLHASIPTPSPQPPRTSLARADREQVQRGRHLRPALAANPLISYQDYHML